MEEKVLPPSIGTTLKIAVTANLGTNIHLEDVDFECKFFTGVGNRAPLTVRKEDMLYVSADEYIAVVDTSVVGTGEYWLQMTAYVPDDDVVGGIRIEKATAPTGIRVKS